MAVHIYYGLATRYNLDNSLWKRQFNHILVYEPCVTSLTEIIVFFGNVWYGEHYTLSLFYVIVLTIH
jgi:hypothetical protein